MMLWAALAAGCLPRPSGATLACTVLAGTSLRQLHVALFSLDAILTGIACRPLQGAGLGVKSRGNTG
jgi:hypothetical protein